MLRCICALCCPGGVGQIWARGRWWYFLRIVVKTTSLKFSNIHHNSIYSFLYESLDVGVPLTIWFFLNLAVKSSDLYFVSLRVGRLPSMLAHINTLSSAPRFGQVAAQILSGLDCSPPKVLQFHLLSLHTPVLKCAAMNLWEFHPSKNISVVDMVPLGLVPSFRFFPNIHQFEGVRHKNGSCAIQQPISSTAWSLLSPAPPLTRNSKQTNGGKRQFSFKQ